MKACRLFTSAAMRLYRGEKGENLRDRWKKKENREGCKYITV